jgi:hypothetical protein
MFNKVWHINEGSMKNSLFFIIPLFIVINLQAQQYNISGKALDSAKMAPLFGANVQIINQDDKHTTGNNTDKEGNFLITGIAPGKYIIKVSYIGYKTFERKITLRDRDMKFPRIILSPNSIVLNPVTAEGEMPLFEQKGDTIQYAVDSSKLRDGESSEDLVKKLPGISIDKRSGKVESNGEEVRKVYIDKKPYLGDNPSGVLKNFPAKHVKNVQVFDEKSDQAKFTGVPDNQTIKVMNLETRFEGGIKEGQLNKFSAAYGTEDKYDLSAYLARFSNNGKLTLYAQSNNLNNNGFTFENNSVSSIFGYRSNRNMDSKVHSLGASYTNTFSGPFQYTGSYSLSYGNSDIKKDISRDYNRTGGINQVYNESQETEAKILNHNLNFKIKYDMDSLTNILFTPTLTYQSNDNNSLLKINNYLNNNHSSNIQNDNTSDNKLKTINGNLLINRILSDEGSKLSLNFGGFFNDKDIDEEWNSINHFFNIRRDTSIEKSINTAGKTSRINSNLLYTMPINSNNYIQSGYYYTYNKDKSDKRAYSVISGDFSLDSLTSNMYEKNYTTHKFGGRYYYEKSGYKINLGLFYNIDKSNQDQFTPARFSDSRSFKNILPELTASYTGTDGCRLNLQYSSNAVIPSLEKMQQYIDQSNALLISAGNPDLKESISHFLSFDYSIISKSRTSNYTIRLTASITNDFIGNNTILASKDTIIMNNIHLLPGARFIYPVNMNNQLSLNPSISFFSRLFTTLQLRTQAYYKYSKNPNMINNALNYSYSNSAGGLITFGFYPSRDIEINLFTDIKNTNSYGNSVLRNNYMDIYNNFNSTIGLPYDFKIQMDITHQYYSNLYDNETPNDILINMYLSKKFLKEKELELKLIVYDLLNKSNPQQKRVTDLYIEESRIKAPKRCIMLSVTYDLKSFN